MADLTNYYNYDISLNEDYDVGAIDLMDKTTPLWTNLDNSMDEIKDDVEMIESSASDNDDKIDKYKTLLTSLDQQNEDNDTLQASNSDLIHSNTYILFMTWVFIFFILLVILCIQVVEDSSQMNLFFKAFVGLFMIFMFYHIGSNVYHSFM